MATENALIVIEPAAPAELFKADVIDMLLSKGKALKDQHVAEDVTTAAGRKAEKAFARQFVAAKTTVDGIGKTYVAELKALPKEVDALRKKVRDTMDLYRDEVLRPVQDWEDAENEKARLECLAAKKAADEIEAYDMETLFERERKVAEQEADLARQAEERRLAEEQEAQAKEQAEREERIAREAAEKAATDAAEALRLAKERAEHAERDRVAAEEKAKADQEAAVREAERKAAQDAERKEAERVATEQAEKAKAEKAANNKRHRQVVTMKAVSALAEALLEIEVEDAAKEIAQQVVDWISEGKVPNVTLNY